jgi:hypothetical protein
MQSERSDCLRRLRPAQPLKVSRAAKGAPCIPQHLACSATAGRGPLRVVVRMVETLLPCRNLPEGRKRWRGQKTPRARGCLVGSLAAQGASLHEAGAKERVRALQAPVVFLFVPRARPGAVVYCSCKHPFVSS